MQLNDIFYPEMLEYRVDLREKVKYGLGNHRKPLHFFKFAKINLTSLTSESMNIFCFFFFFAWFFNISLLHLYFFWHIFVCLFVSLCVCLWIDLLWDVWSRWNEKFQNFLDWFWKWPLSYIHKSHVYIVIIWYYIIKHLIFNIFICLCVK